MAFLYVQVRGFAKGGLFQSRVHPRVKQVLRGVKQEANLRREGINRFNKRWRSWAVKTARQISLPKQVVLTADPALMDCEYLSTCIIKAGLSKCRDIDLWRGYVKRLGTLLDEMPPVMLGYTILGFGKVEYSGNAIYAKMMERALTLTPEMHSTGLMAIMWTAKRVQFKPSDSLMSAVVDRTIESIQTMRPADFIKSKIFLPSCSLYSL